MYVYVLSVSRTRLRLGLAQFYSAGSDGSEHPEHQVQAERLERLELDITRSDIEWPQEDSRPPTLARALELTRRQTADWPAPSAVATLAQWEAAKQAPATPDTDATANQWAQQGQVALVTPEHLAAAEAQLAQSTVQGELSLRLALAWATELQVPLLAVPLPRGAELPAAARETGIPKLKLEPEFHVLNSEVVAREAAFAVGNKFAESAVVVAHLGSSSSVTAYQGGRVVSSTGAGLSGGPMGLRQAGALSPAALLRLEQGAASGEFRSDWPSYWKQCGGLKALTGYGSVRDLAAAEASDPRVEAAAEALVYQVACAAAGQCGALTTRPDALALTGPLAGWSSVADRLERRLGWIAPVFIIPGDLEFEAVARAAGRVLMQWAEPHRWQSIPETPVSQPLAEKAPGIDVSPQQQYGGQTPAPPLAAREQPAPQPVGASGPATPSPVESGEQP